MKDLSQLREEIDKIDREVLALLNRRAKLAQEVGEIKKQEGLPFYVPGREAKILSKLEEINQGPLPAESVRAIFREIISACRALEEPTKVAYLGPKATFTHLAALKQFGSSSNLRPMDSIGEVFNEVEKGRVDYGVVPIENSIEGVVNYTIDMFFDTDLKICGEIFVPVNLHLMSKESDLSQIKKVYSHRHAIAQARKWISEYLPKVDIEEVSSTSKAAELASQEPNTAAIASEAAAYLYDLSILARNIQELSKNFTRFLVIGKEDSEFPSGRDKTSIMFSTKHVAGSLFKALQPFAIYDVNLSKIESRPTKKRPWEYVFFVDIEGHRKNERVAKALKELQSNTTFFKILGSYPAGFKE
ncbi:chorismate mutase [Desulfurobacterium thermolithotrophum DSM 11699]|uniref:Bifunctional chorismate mutase/prephenate dehydratase n=1 Tax=Desulfurobacterium thermolithotrophum (strain DSM 11699 / BSA) TaxID=868864 RepID=F0S1W4_DESTD|nr:prephenate dehydratase [Desulfurobacterium thermolithotrophum]ADY74045.1 chorismate mutase [Desulfurobacterium thermolithotrophum DSM 11699]